MKPRMLMVGLTTLVLALAGSVPGAARKAPHGRPPRQPPSRPCP